MTSGLGQLASLGAARSCSFRVDTVDSFGRGVPNDDGIGEPERGLGQLEGQQLGLRDAVVGVVLVVLDHDVARAQ